MTYEDIPVADVEFQSLFSWMSLLNSLGDVQVPDMTGVSILVLVDVALEHGHFGDVKSISSMFQSLFSWMSLLNA